MTSKYITVAEVCEKTKLDRKQLFNFKDVVKPIGYKNQGHYCRGYERNNKDVVGYDSDGYKLYEEEAVIKLQQIKIFKELGIRNKEIKEILSNENYDCNEVLDYQIKKLQEKIDHFKELIQLAESLKIFGVKDQDLTKYIMENYNSQNVLEIRKSSDYNKMIEEFVDNLEKIPQENKDIEFFNQIIKLKNDRDNIEAIYDETTKFTDWLDANNVNSIFMLSILTPALKGKGELAEEYYKIYGEEDIQFLVYAFAIKIRIDLGKELSVEAWKIEKEQNKTFENPIIQESIKNIHDICIKYLFQTNNKEIFKASKIMCLENIFDIDEETRCFVSQAIDDYCSK